MLYENEKCAAFLDIQPVNPGHTLVIPRQHAPSLSDLDGDTGGQLFKTAQIIAAALYASDLESEGINFFLADGEAAGQEVFHVHLHVFPRYEGDGFGLTFAPRYFSPPRPEALSATAAKIRTWIDAEID